MDGECWCIETVGRDVYQVFDFEVFDDTSLVYDFWIVDGWNGLLVVSQVETETASLGVV